jgi:hypothetical protein
MSPLPTNRRRFLTAVATAALAPGFLSSRAETTTDFVLQPELNIIPAPTQPEQWAAYRASLSAWREATLRNLNYTGRLYDVLSLPGSVRIFAATS